MPQSIIPVSPFRKVVSGGGQQIPPYLPLIFPSVLEEYYDTRLGMSGYADNAPVTTWFDQSGKVRNMTDAGTPAAPTMQRDAGNLTPRGVPTVFWSAGASSALGSGTLNPYPVNTNGMCFFSHAYRSNTGAAVEWQDGSGGQPQLIWNTTNLIGWRDALGTHGITGIGPYIAKFVQICWNFKTTGVCDLYVNGVLKGSDNWAWANPATEATELGNNQTFAAPMDSLQSHFVWYSRAMTYQEIQLHATWSNLYFGNQ